MWTPKEIEKLFYMDLHELGMKANSLNDDIVTFVVNRHINYTNICVSKCPLCAFHRNPNDEDAYLMSVEDVVKKAEEAVRLGAKELHIVGSHNPDVTIEYFEEMFSELDKLMKAASAATQETNSATPMLSPSTSTVSPSTSATE